MTSTKISRRDFLRLFGVGAGTVLLNACAPQVLTETVFSPTDTSEIDTTGAVDIEVALKATESEVQILPGKATRVWQYQGEVLSGPEDAIITIPDTYLGPVFNLNKGQRVRVYFTNELQEESIVHWHGLHVPVEADGHPRLAIKTGETYIYEFTVLDRAGTYWYHPHPHGRTGVQAYAGLAGLFIIHDEN